MRHGHVRALLMASAGICGRQAGISQGVSATSCHPALLVHSPVRRPLPTSSLRMWRRSIGYLLQSMPYWIAPGASSGRPIIVCSAAHIQGP